MKKTFTLAMAAMISLSALAIAPRNGFTPTLKQAPTEVVQFRSLLPKKSVSRAEAEGPTFHDGVNTADVLSYNFYYLGIDFNPKLTSYQRDVVMELKEGGKFELPYYMGLECTLKGEFVKNEEGNLELQIPLGQKLTTITYQGQDYDLMFIAINYAISEEFLSEGYLPVAVGDNAMSSIPQYDSEGEANAWYLFAAAKMGSQWGYFAGAGDLYIFLPNSTLDFDWVSPQAAQEGGDPVQYKVDRYVEVYADTEENIHVSAPFCSLIGEYPMDEYAMVFGDMDDYGYMVFEDQIVYSSYDQTTGGNLDFYLCTFDPSSGPLATILEGQANENSELLFEGWCNCTSLTGQYYWLGYDNYMTISYGQTGIEDIKADDVDNSNAPVEYFNLQGMRIANPAAGQIVIRRQGTEATKLFVK